MPDPRPAALAVVLGAWFAVSVLHQLRRGRWTGPIRRRLPFGLIPSWSFFAPNPARADHRLVWRDERDGHWGGWQEIVLPRAPMLRQGVLNPEAVPPKALSDLVGIMAPSTADDDPTWLLSAAYLALLRVVVHRARNPGADAVQFAVLHTRWGSGDRRVDVAFLSAEHALDPVDAR